MGLAFVEEFAAELLDVGTQTELWASLDRAKSYLGFDHFALSLEGRTASELSLEVLLHDYPEEWAQVYVNFDLAGHDPVRRACDRSFAGFTWDSIGRLIPLSKGDRQMLAVGRECGLADGYTVPRYLPGRARGTCSFVVRPERLLPSHQLGVAEMVGALALSCALKTSGMLEAAPHAKLSDRQRECLLWSARGKTAAETALILGISAETVVQHLKMARERYDVHCRQSLILCALFDGLIGFGDIMQRRTYA